MSGNPFPPNARSALLRAFVLSLLLHCVALAVVTPDLIAPAGISLSAFNRRPITLSLLASIEVPHPAPGVAAALLPAHIESAAAPELPAPTPGGASPEATAGFENAVRTEPPSVYRRASELSSGPVPMAVGNLNLDRELSAGRRGRLVLEIHINELGRADEIFVVEDSVSEHLMINALRVFEFAEYRPGMDQGRPVKSRLLIEIDLDREAVAGQSMPTPAGGQR